MPIVYNKFRNHQVSAKTEILLLGTFSPDMPDGADFFYGRARNFLWYLLPKCWDLESLKEASLSEKQLFMAEHKLDFADLIDAIEIPEGEESNVEETFIDQHVSEWKDIIALIAALPNLKAVYFTRKTFNGIGNMRVQANLIAGYCKDKEIRFCKLETPAKFHSIEKQQQWIDTIVLQNTCLKP